MVIQCLDGHLPYMRVVHYKMGELVIACREKLFLSMAFGFSYSDNQVKAF